jgi:hypothetical protein
MSTKSDKIFKLTNFSPIGFKVMNYPVQFCSLCRGYLTEPCSICMEKRNENCTVLDNDGSFYHNHCYIFMNSENNFKAKSKKYHAEPDSE